MLKKLIKRIKKAFSFYVINTRREIYFKFMNEYNELQGKGEQEILKEEVEVLLARHR
jgi:hypothetical protein